MRLRLGIGKYLGGLALAAMFALGAAQEAHAGGPECKAYNQAGAVNIALTQDCTISGNVISTGGGVTVTGAYNFTVTGKITSGGGQDIYVNPKSVNVTGVITSAGNVTVNASAGDVTLGNTVTSAASDYVYLWGNNITTKAITAGGYIQATANGNGNTLAFNGAVKSTNSYILLFGQRLRRQAQSAQALIFRQQLRKPASSSRGLSARGHSITRAVWSTSTPRLTLLPVP